MSTRALKSRRHLWGRFGAAAVVALLAACSGDGDTTDPLLGPSFSTHGGDGELVLCKVTAEPTATIFDFEVSATGGRVPGSGRFSLAATQSLTPGPECEVVWVATDGSDVTVTIEELPSLGWEIFGVFYSEVGFLDPVTNPFEITVGPAGGLVIVKNEPAPIDMAPGRMTGGGGQFNLADVHITRGFTIHCDITLSNNVEVNWEGNSWHIDKPLTSAVCIDDPAVEPAPPPAPFDTFIGEGVGRLNGVDGSVIRFTFVDAGEPSGNGDAASIAIWAPGDDPDVDPPYLAVSGPLEQGNIQAHYDQPHR